ncbi:MAG: hypothetical protein A2Z25_01755 [Planctomycetes bacterium RBG_16_55_9]|nr:MAG: hypothetical protein A2Z25_01755 [Planctomycetes bacterium RBG_16_55_9]
MRKCILCVLLAFLIFAQGCKSHMGDFTLITTKNINLTSFSSHGEESGERVSGEDAQFFFFSIPVGFCSIKEAVDDALDKKNSYMLIDATIYYERFWIPLCWWGHEKFEVTGVPIERGY